LSNSVETVQHLIFLITAYHIGYTKSWISNNSQQWIWTSRWKSSGYSVEGSL